MKATLVLVLLALINTSVLGQHVEREEVNQDTTVRRCVLRYPAEARKKGIQGTVEIKVVFDAQCNIKYYEVVKSLGYGCDEVAIECLINVQEKIKKNNDHRCIDGFEIVYPFYFKLAE